MNPRLRKLSCIFLRTIAALTLLLVIASVVVWGFRARIATSFAHSYLQGLGLSEPHLTITQLETDSLVVESIAFAYEGSQFAAEHITVSYSLSELLELRRIEEATIKGATLTLNSGSLPKGNNSEASNPPSLEALAHSLDLSGSPPLPFKGIQIVDSTLMLENESHSIPLSFSAIASATDTNALDFHAQFAHADHSLELGANLSKPDQNQFNVSLHLSNPVALLDRYVPAWNSELPVLKGLASSALELQATLKPGENATPQLDAVLKLRDLSIEYEEVSADLSLLSATTSLTDFADIPLQVSLTHRHIVRDTLAVLPQQTIEFDSTLSNFNVVTFQTRNPIDWIYDSGYITAASNVQLRYELEDTNRPLQTTIENGNVVINEIEFDAFSLTAAGTTSQLTFQSSPLSLAQHTPATLEGVTGSLEIPKPPDAPIALRLNATLQPAALAFNGGNVTLPSAQLDLRTFVFDTRSESTLTLAVHGQDPLADLPGMVRIQGGLTLTSHVKKESEFDLITGWTKLDASNVSIQSERLSGDGIGIQSQIDFTDLDTNTVIEFDLSDETAMTHLLGQLSAELDWQANQLSAPTSSAQWSGGSLALKTEAGEVVITSSFGAGILNLDKIRIDQLYLENEHRGTLAALRGSSQATAMLDGISLQVDSQQRINAPLTDLSLSGEYILAPTNIVHSDLPGRFTPELAGMSVSANLQATGTFHANSENADASLSLKASEGAISYPASQVQAHGLALDLELASLANLDSGGALSSLRIEDIEAGDLKSIKADSQFRIRAGNTLSIDSANVSLFGGQAKLGSTQIPLDGSDFQGNLELQSFDLAQIASYIEIFDGQMQGKVSGYLPFRLRKGNFELLRGDLRLPDGSPASLKYNTTGLLTDDSPQQGKPSFSERFLKFLKVNPDLAAEQALGDITISAFETELFPEDDPQTPIRIRLEGVAHSGLGDIPVVIDTQVRGSLSELYNFLIRLNSL